MKIKKIWAALLCLAITLGALTACGSQGNKSNSSNGLTFSMNEDRQSYTCTGLGACIDTDLVIDTYKGLPVTAVKENAFFGCKNLTSVTLGNSVTHIGEWSFHGCTKLTSVTLGQSIENIGFSAFDNCYRLVEVINHSTLEIAVGSPDHGYVALHAMEVHHEDSKIVTQDSFVFYPLGDTSYLVSYTGSSAAISLPDSYNGNTYAIRKYAFSGCETLATVSLGNGVTNVGESAFSGCQSLLSVALGDKVTSIGNYAFFGCTSLCAVNLGNLLTSIGNSAFQNCGLLTAVTIPHGLQSLGGQAFLGCSSLKNIYFTGNQDTWLALVGDTNTGIPSSAEIHYDHQS